MATLRDIRKRIKSINSTSKVTHAMELVSASKMRKSQESALSSRPYTNALNEVLSEVRAKATNVNHALLTDKDSQKELLILLTTDRGLVGGLNLNLFREAIKNDLKKTSFVVVGKKGLYFVSKNGSEMLASFESEEQAPLDLARTLTKIAVDLYSKGEVSKVRILYPDFQSTIKQVPAQIQLLPIELSEDTQVQVNKDTKDMLFEPDADTILESILPHYVLTRVYQAILEAKASEHSARMIAMKNATDAANDLVDDLTLTYNQARQEAITKELLDIITAQAAFE